MKNKLLVILLALTLVIAVAGCSEDNTKEDGEITESEEAVTKYIDVNPEEAAELIESTPDIIIIDVSPVYDRGHLPDAVNYPLGDGSFDEAIPTLDMYKTYLIYCHGDKPAITAAKKLFDAGFMNVYRLAGNYAAWVDAGYDTEK